MTSLDQDNPRLAAAYDRLSDSQFEAGQMLVERLCVKPGDRVLDVGCGTGRLTKWISDRFGMQGVVGIDPLPDRIAIAKERSPGLDFRVGRAEDLEAFPDETFDVVCLSAVFHWIKDKPKALCEIRRVLRHGGRMGLTTMPKELHLQGTLAKFAASVFGRSPYRERINRDGAAFFHEHSLTITELVTAVLASGLELDMLGATRTQRKHETEQDAIDFVEASSFGNFLRLVPDDLRISLRADLVAAFGKLKGPEGIVMHDYGMMLLARRP